MARLLDDKIRRLGPTQGTIYPWNVVDYLILDDREFGQKSVSLCAVSISEYAVDMLPSDNGRWWDIHTEISTLTLVKEVPTRPHLRFGNQDGGQVVILHDGMIDCAPNKD